MLVHDSLLFVGRYSPSAEAGLVVLSIADPIRPIIVGEWRNQESDPYGLAASADRVVMGDGPCEDLAGGFRFFTIDGAGHPVHRSRLTVSDGISAGAVLLGDTALLCNGAGGLVVADLSDISHPRSVRTYAEFSPVMAGVVGRLVVIANEYAGVLVVDGTDILALRLVGRYTTAGVARAVVVDDPHSIHVANDYGGYLLLDYFGPLPAVAETPVGGAGPRPVGLALRPSPGKEQVIACVTLSRASEVTLELRDSVGRALGVLFEGSLPAGVTDVSIGTRELPAGVYFVAARVGVETHEARLVVSH